MSLYMSYTCLRVMDVVLDNIITEVIDWDKSEDFEKSFQRALRHPFEKACE